MLFSIGTKVHLNQLDLSMPHLWQLAALNDKRKEFVSFVTQRSSFTCLHCYSCTARVHELAKITYAFAFVPFFVFAKILLDGATKFKTTI